MSDIDEIQNRVQKIYIQNSRDIENLSIIENIEYFINITNVKNQDINDLRLALVNYMDNELGDVNVDITKYSALNEILLITEIEYLARLTGSTALSADAGGESFDGGSSFITTLSSLIGGNSIANISDYDDDTITGVIGNTPLPEIILINNTLPAADSISAEIDLLIKAVEAAIGTGPLEISKSLTLNSCTMDEVGPVIYSTCENPSIIDAINGIYACASWASNSNGFIGLVNLDLAPYCVIRDSCNALSDCLYYLTGNIFD